MATVTFYKGDGLVVSVEAASTTGLSTQLADFAGIEISASNKGFFWKVNSATFTPTHGSIEKEYVGTNLKEYISSLKEFTLDLDIDWYDADGDVVLAGTTTNLHAVDPYSILSQIIGGDGETYTFGLYWGCTKKANAVDSAYDYADPDTNKFFVTLEDVSFETIPMNATPNAIMNSGLSFKVRNATVS